MVRQPGQNLRRGKRNVQEKPDPVAVTTAAQGVRNGDQVVVMDPDQIIILDDFLELGRETIIDPEISAEIPGREPSEVQPVMQDWPQYPICKAAVIFLKILLGQIRDCIFDVLMPDRARFQLVRRRDLATPAEPDPALVLERWPQYDFEPASPLDAVARNGNAI